MSFLTPLYLLAGLAVTLPIVFHMIRRTPKGRQVFSSLMFLEPSPPKLTKPSRLENLLLLFLRGLAIFLIAFAFARPFLRAQAETDSGQDAGRRLAILLDRSASMQQDGFWEQAIEHVSRVLGEVAPNDDLSVIAFDQQMTTIVEFEDWAELELDSRKRMVLDRLESVQPSSFATELGQALVTAADILDQKTEREMIDRKLFVISDFQTGSRWEALNGYEWPENVHVELLPVKTNGDTTNASMHLIANEAINDNSVRLRVANSEEAQSDIFNIGWVDQFSAIDEKTGEMAPSETSRIYVPPGQSKVLRAPEREIEFIPEQVVLTGDAVKFDNTCFVALRRPWDVQIVFMGNEDRQGADSLRFFLDPVFPETPTRTVQISDWKLDEPVPPVDEQKITLVVIGGTCSTGQLEWTRNWVRDGGQLLFVATNPEQGQQLYDILETAPAPITEGSIEDYIMLGSVNLQHPVFAPFDDPRFANFSKLRFYGYREIDLSSLPNGRVLASFEGGVPAITEIPIDDGRIMLFSAGWNRSESDLAVWSKFVPMMNGMLEYLGNRADHRPQFYVGDRVTPTDLGLPEQDVLIQRFDGSPQNIASGEEYLLKSPGIYVIGSDEEQLTNDDALRVSVNLHPDESQTQMLEFETLAAAGLPVDRLETSAEAIAQSEASQRQMMNRELEDRQKFWKWLVLAALIVLILETILAGIQQRRPMTVPTGQ